MIQSSSPEWGKLVPTTVGSWEGAETSRPPALPVEAPVLDSFCQMFGRDGLALVQISDGAGHFQDAVVGACRQAQPLHGVPEQFLTGFSHPADLPGEFGGHMGIAVNSLFVLESFFLHLSCGDDSVADGLTYLGDTFLVQLLKRNGDDLHVQIDAVEQRSADPVDVFLDQSGLAYTIFVGMVVISTGAGFIAHLPCRFIRQKNQPKTLSQRTFSYWRSYQKEKT